MSGSTSSRQPSAAPKGCNVLPCCECSGFVGSPLQTHVCCAAAACAWGLLGMGAQLLWEQGAHMGDGQSLQI